MGRSEGNPSVAMPNLTKDSLGPERWSYVGKTTLGVDGR